MLTLEDQKKLEERVEELDALISQKKEAIQDYVQEMNNLQRNIRVLEVDQDNLKSFIDEKVSAEKACWKEANEKQEAIVIEAQNIKRDLVHDREVLRKEREEHEAWKAKETEDIQKKHDLLVKADNESRTQRIKNEEISKELRRKDGLIDERNERCEESEDQNTREIERLVKKEKYLTDKENELITWKEVLDKICVNQSKEIDNINKQIVKNLKAAEALDAKEKELKAIKEGLKQDIKLSEDKTSGILDQKQDAVILGKKNAKEKERLDKLAVDLHNRENKLAENEKLFKEKLGG